MLTPLFPYLPPAVAQAIKAGTSHGRLYQERIEGILTACQEEFKVPAPGSDAAEYHADLRAEMVRQMEPLAKRLPLYLARMGFQGYQVAVYKGPNVYLPGERGRMYPAVQVSATSDLHDALTVTVGCLPSDEYGVESVRTIRGTLKPEQALAMGRYVAGPNFQGFGPEEISDASYLFSESWLEGLLPKWSLALSTTHIGLPPGDRRLLDVLVRMGLTYFLEDAKVSKVTLPQDGPREAFEIRKVPPLRWMDALPFRSILIQHTSRGDLDNQARITFQRTPRGDWRVESIVHTAVGWKLAKRPERDPEFSTTWAENLGEIAEEMAAVVLAATGKTNALPPAPVRIPTPAPRTPTPVPRSATPAPRTSTPPPPPSVPAAPTHVDEEYTGKVAKLFSRLKASIGVESYKGTGSKRADRQIWVRFTNGAVIDVWITEDNVNFAGVVSSGGKGRVPRPILYGDRTPAGTFNEIERALATWAGVDLPPEPAAVPLPTVRPATGGATNSVHVPTTYERVTAEILPGAQIQQTAEGVYQIQRDGWTATVTWQVGGLWQAQVWDLSHRAQGFPDALRWLVTATAPDPLAGEITHVQQLGLSKDSPLGDLFAAAQPRVQHVFEHLLGLPPRSDTSPRLQAAWYLYGGPAVSGWLSQRGYETGTGFSNLWARWSPGNVALPDPFAELQEADWRTEAALTVALNRIAPFYTPWTVTAVRSGHVANWDARVSSPVLSDVGMGSEKTRMAALQSAVQSRNLWKAVWKDRLSGPMGNDLERLRDALAPASATIRTPSTATNAPGSRGDGGEDPTALMQAPVGTIVLVRGRNNVDRQFTKRRMPDSADDNVWHNSATGMVASNDIGPYRVVSTTPAAPAAPAAPAHGYFVSAQRAGNASGGVLLAGPYPTKEQAEGDVNRVRSLVYRYFSSDPQAAFAGYGVAEGPRDALAVFTMDGEVNPAWEARAAAPSGPTMITVHTKRPVNRHTVPLARLLADYKARGLDDQGAWRELIKDRGLSPEIDFKALRDAYAAARAQRLAEEDIEEEVPWEATHFDTVTEKYVMVTQKENGGWRTIWANGYHGGDPPGPLSERYRPIALEAFDLARLDDYQQRQLRAVLSGEVITGDDRLLDAWQEARNAVEPDPISSITSVPNPESLGTRGTFLIAYKDAWKSSPHAALWHARRGNAAGEPEEAGAPEAFDHLNVSLHFEDGTWQHLMPALSAVRDQWTNAILTPWAKKQEEKYKRGKVMAVDGYGTTPEGVRVRAARWVAGKGVLQAPGDPVQVEGTGGSPDGVVRDKDLLYLLYTLKQFEGYPARIPWTEVGPYTLAAVNRGFLLRQDIGKRLHWQTTEAGKKFLGKTWTDSVGMELGWRAAVEARTAVTDATLRGDEWRFRIIDLNMVAARISDDLRGSDRSDLLAYILETQTLAEAGPPTPPPGARVPNSAPFAPRSPAPGAPAPRRAATPAPVKVGTTNESKGVRYELHGRSGVAGEFSTLSEAQGEARKHGPVRWKSPRGEPKDGVIRTVYHSDGDYEIVAFKPDDPLYVPTVDPQPEVAFVPTHHDWTVGRDVRIDGNAAAGWRVTRPLGARRYSEDEDHLPPGTIDADRYTPLSTGADKPVDNPRVFPWVAGVLDAAEQALGVELDRNPLGMGANGQVFAVVGDHRALVVKITAEEKEVRGILRLQERARHRVPMVHAVVPLGTVDRRPDYAEDPTEGYAILRDAVTPISDAEAAKLVTTWTGPKVERETIATRLKVHGVRLYDWEKHKENRGWTPQYGQMLPPYWWADNAAFAFNYWMHQPSTTSVLRARMQVLQEYAGWLGMIAGHFSPPGQPPHPLTALLVASQGPGEVLQGAFSDFGLGNLGRNAKGELVWFDIHWNDLAPKPIDVVIAEAFPAGATPMSTNRAPHVDAPRSTRVPRIPPPTLPRTATRGPQDIVNRATLYELVVTDGSRTYLVAYVQRNNYAGILSALQKRGPALLRLIYGTEKHDDRVAKLEGQPGYRFHGEPPWFVLLTGRTQRDMMASGLEYAYIEDVQQPAPVPRRATPAPVRGATPAPRTATPAPTVPEKASPGDWVVTLDGNDLKIYRATGAGEGKYVARVATMLGNRRIQSFRAHPDRQGASNFAEAPDFTVTRTFGGKTLPMAADPLVRHYLPQVGYPVAAHEHVWVRLSTGALSLAHRIAPHASGFATGHVADAPAPKRVATPRPTARPATPRPTARPAPEPRAPRERVPTEGCQDAEFAWGGVTVKVTCGAVGAKGVWHNIQVIGGAKKLFYGWNGERWSRSEIPGDDLLRAVWGHGIRVFPNGRG